MSKETLTSTAALWQVASRIHNETGYWGPVDANHQFCEPHYVTTIYLAEFWNSISSFFIVAVAWLAYKKTTTTIGHHSNPQHHEFVDDNKDQSGTSDHQTRTSISNQQRIWWMTVGCVWLAVIGVGSFLFHGTMRRSMQLLDEIPMIGFIGTSMLWKLDKHSWTRHYYKLYRVVLGFIHVALVWIYCWLDSYEFFLHGFTVLVGIEFVLCYTWWTSPATRVFNNRNASLVCIIVGKALWEVENRFCETVPSVWPLHVLWHIMSGLSAYYGVLYNNTLTAPDKKPF